MSENQRSTADEVESGLNTGADLAGEALKNRGLPSRPNKGGGNSSGSGSGNPSSGDSGGPSGNQGPQAPDGMNGPQSPDGSGPHNSGGSDAGSGSGSDKSGADSGAGSDKAGSDASGGSDSGGSDGGASGQPGLDTPKAPEGGSNASGNDGGGGKEGSGENGQNSSGDNSGGSGDNSGGQKGADPSGSGSDPSGGGDGLGGSSGADAGASSAGSSGAGAGAEAGSAAGSSSSAAAGAGGSAAGSGGAAAGGAAAGSGAAAGGAAAGGAAAGGAASGAAAGATVGTAAGPIGTVAGAVAGALLVPLLKLIFGAVATVVVFISFFMMHPSFLYDNNRATNDRTVIENTYNYYFKHVQTEYKKDIESQMGKAGANALIIATPAIFDANVHGDTTLLFSGPSSYPYISMSEEDQTIITDILEANEYDEIKFDWTYDFVRSKDEYLESASSNINLVLSMIDTQKKHWFISLFEGVADYISGGYYSRFTDWVGKKWEGFWNDFITYELYSISLGEDALEEGTDTVLSDPAGLAQALLNDDDDDDLSEYFSEVSVLTITVTYTYDLKDQGVGYYADKMNLSQEQIDRATEMAHYLGDLFGSNNGDYFGWYVQGGYHVDAVSGGSVGANIAAGLEAHADAVSGLTFDPDHSPQVFPLQGYVNPPMSSAYGPRNFAPDPWHTGIDFSAPGGTPIVSIADGVIIHIGQMKGGFGNYVVVSHGTDFLGDMVSTMYAHMSAFGPQRVGDTVRMGEVIGYVGRTGLSTGNHLHFEVHIDGNRYNPVETLEVFRYLRPGG